MGIGDELNKVVANVKDAVGQASHETNAEAEQTKRDAAGDALTPGEKLGSIANQGKESFLGGVDATKRDVRSEV